MEYGHWVLFCQSCKEVTFQTLSTWLLRWVQTSKKISKIPNPTEAVIRSLETKAVARPKETKQTTVLAAVTTMSRGCPVCDRLIHGAAGCRQFKSV